jgi:outer membrane lipoprotein-sorting protein
MTARLVAFGVALAAVVAVAPGLAQAEEAGGACARLTKLDQDFLSFDDQEYHAAIAYSENGSLVKNFNLRILTKGSHKVLVSFVAPGEMRGTRVLVADAETMYTFLPDFGRIRRIAGHSRRQAFMGTNLYYEDITERRFSLRWQCTPVKTTPTGWVMDLQPKAGTTSAYTRLRLTIQKQRGEIERIEYFEEDRHMKTQERSGWKVMGGLERASEIRFVSHDRNAELRIEYTLWKVNIGIPDSAFTQRALLRGL